MKFDNYLLDNYFGSELFYLLELRTKLLFRIASLRIAWLGCSSHSKCPYSSLLSFAAGATLEAGCSGTSHFTFG